ncbi:Entericidin EcnA/B family protein [Rhodovulum sp. ES.010]|nr:entericidin A/B family lipoprotein [Rhodovulum sp. ES.010]SIO20205.1 Entericidin EcnA/B family protein [Rhodovulum sp. ES.010]
MGRTLLILIALTLAACGTVEGMGEDISAGARAVRNAL